MNSLQQATIKVFAQKAVIREAECIGCTKCIQACPVDAIVGAAKQMHSVLTIECIGCGLCLPPCPVDCIDLIEIAALSEEDVQSKTQQAMMRFDTRNVRLAKNTRTKKPEKAMLKRVAQAKISAEEIKQAMQRVIAKKSL